MKTQITLIALLAFLAGCMTAHKASLITVNAAGEAWGDYVRAGLATPKQVAQVKVAWDKYYTAVQAEKAAIVAYQTGIDTNSLNNAMAAVQAAGPAVIEIILQFLPPDRAAKLKGLK